MYACNRIDVFFFLFSFFLFRFMFRSIHIAYRIIHDNLLKSISLIFASFGLSFYRLLENDRSGLGYGYKRVGDECETCDTFSFYYFMLL